MSRKHGRAKTLSRKNASPIKKIKPIQAKNKAQDLFMSAIKTHTLALLEQVKVIARLPLLLRL